MNYRNIAFTFLKVFGYAAVTLLLVFFSFIALVAGSFASTSPEAILSLSVSAFFLLMIAAIFISIKIKGVWWKFLLGYVALFALTYFGIEAYYDDDKKMERVYDGVDITEYQPFSPNLPRLQEPSSLTLNDSLPIMDGALALYPVYSAFATAVYPEKEYDLIENYRGEARYPRYNGDKTIHEVHFTNTVEAYERLLKGEIDIYFMGEISHAQRKQAEDLGIELKFTPIAKDAFVFFVNSQSRVDSLGIEDIRRIYSGEATTWREFGGAGRIRAFQRNKNSGSQSALEHLMDGVEIMPPPVDEKPLGMGGIIKIVADYKNHESAIGFTFRLFAKDMVKNDKIKLLKIDGVEPSYENIKNGSYPIVTKMYAITRKDNNKANVSRMLDWISSPQGQYIVEKSGYVPVSAPVPSHYSDK